MLGQIYAMKQFFAGQSTKPDLYGSEWYVGGPNYNFGCVGNDIAVATNTMASSVYSIPASAIFLGEGGSNQVSNANQYSYYVAAIYAAMQSGMNHISLWNTDGNENTGSCATGDDSGQSAWATFITGTPQLAGCRTFTNSPYGWHLNDTTVTYDDFPVGFGSVPFVGLTTAGTGAASAFDAY
jgi:hypothetical protein